MTGPLAFSDSSPRSQDGELIVVKFNWSTNLVQFPLGKLLEAELVSEFVPYL